jgi:ribosomal protein S18 acetylase RimI-like enzyme
LTIVLGSYFAGMEQIIRDLNLNMKAQLENLRQRWIPTEVRIIALDGRDIGWLQSTFDEDALFLAQFFVEAGVRGQGVGTAVMDNLINEATRADRAITLGVVKTNPALRLYQRLDFRITGEDERKFYMRREVHPTEKSQRSSSSA